MSASDTCSRYRPTIDLQQFNIPCGKAWAGWREDAVMAVEIAGFGTGWNHGWEAMLMGVAIPG